MKIEDLTSAYVCENCGATKMGFRRNEYEKLQ